MKPTMRRPFRRTGSPPGEHGVFVISFVAGLIAAAAAWGLELMGAWLGWIPIPDDSATMTFLFSLLPCFIGGFVSGAILQFDLAKRGMRFLYLAAASPAFPIWLITVLFLMIGIDMVRGAMPAVTVLCVISMVGSILGYLVTNRLRRWSLRPLLNSRLFRPDYPWWTDEPAAPVGGGNKGPRDSANGGEGR